MKAKRKGSRRSRCSAGTCCGTTLPNSSSPGAAGQAGQLPAFHGSGQAVPCSILRGHFCRNNHTFLLVYKHSDTFCTPCANTASAHTRLQVQVEWAAPSLLRFKKAQRPDLFVVSKKRAVAAAPVKKLCGSQLCSEVDRPECHQISPRYPRTAVHLSKAGCTNHSPCEEGPQSLEKDVMQSHTLRAQRR